MKLTVRKLLATSSLLVASGLGLWGIAIPFAGSVAQAALPLTQVGSEYQGKAQEVRRESSMPTWLGPVPLTGPASPFEPLDIPNFGENYRANTDSQSPNLAQQEPSIAINPTNPLNVVAMAKDERAGSNTKQDWIYSSTDGGVTWINQMFPLISPASPFSSDPIVNFSDDGICYVTALPYGGGANDGIQVARSTDGGITFSTGVHLPGTNGGSDKEWTWIDNFPSSPFYHRIYVAWMNFSPGFTAAWSSDRGQTWTQSNLAQPANQFPMPVVLPNGDVIITYYSGGGVSYIRSTDGGISFGGTHSISGISTPRCPPDNSGCGIWRLNAIPANSVNRKNGAEVVVWADGSGNTATIRYSRSTDNGNTWSPSAILAPPGVANTYQVEPWVEADETGIFHAIWYDDRENPNTSIFHIYYSQSTDDGATWSDAVRISTATSDLRIGIPSSYARAAGDYINVTASHGNVYGVWTDTRAGNGEDVYVVRGLYGSAVGTPTATPTGTPPTATRTRTPTQTATPTPTTCGSYQIGATSTATIVAGTTDVGNHTDDGVTTINLPFAFSLYGISYTIGSVSSNGNFQFVSSDPAYENSCLPTTSFGGPVMLAFWDDLLTNGTSCSPSPCGIFTSTSGSAPNRIFNIEWRTTYYSGAGSANFELRLYEGAPSRFDVIMGVLASLGTGTTGVQDMSGVYTEYQCNTSAANNIRIPFIQTGCGTPVATNTPVGSTPTATPCQMNFSDVNPNDYFYEAVHYLYCRGVISGYSDGTFRPYNNTTRGQICKIVVLALGWTIDTSGGPHFTDVPTTHAFYVYIETAYNHGSVSGYNDGTFRPDNNVTRAQLSKIITLAEGWVIDTSGGPHFSDVPESHAFYGYVETAYNHGVITGYSDGTFRPDTYATRGQICVIIYRAVNPE